MKPHPGWKVNGTISRERQTLIIQDGGKYDSTFREWVFKALDIETGETWYILPRVTDVYMSPNEEKHNMVSRNWIVVSKANGPSYVPNQHTTIESAIEEAKRLALKHPSDKFFVYELCKAFQIDTVKEIEVGDIPF